MVVVWLADGTVASAAPASTASDAGAAFVFTTITGGLTSTPVYWLSPASTNCTFMATSAFDTDISYQRQLQAQAMRMVAAQQNQLNNCYVNHLPAAPSVITRSAPSDERAAHARRANEEAHRARLTREVAEARAKELLLEHLTDEQRETLARENWFIVEGGVSRKRYRIRTDRGVAGNVAELGRGDHVVARLCCHVRHGLAIPDFDQFLAQKLMIEGDEDAYQRIANRLQVTNAPI